MIVRSIGLALAISAAACGLVRADDLAAMSQNPKQWVMPARDYASTRSSPLDQINVANVGKLQAAWMFSVGTARGQEAAPLIIGDTLYHNQLVPQQSVRSRFRFGGSEVDLCSQSGSGGAGGCLL